MGVANVASSSDSTKPTFQHHHGDGTSLSQRSGASAGREKFIGGVNGAHDWKDCFLSVESLADGLARSNVTEKQLSGRFNDTFHYNIVYTRLTEGLIYRLLVLALPHMCKHPRTS
ncbi:hypothetical protein DBV15_07412 [Temnothorax longispinosus]|uniref:Uncharacterized protein n=1 Tax=Temnothorax longispinosus TaxID=300112 RepID=A0A4S2JK18_9HYME|nr:hypothetical protein DBV15_07412 [Temnothorax longispinosus]